MRVLGESASSSLVPFLATFASSRYLAKVDDSIYYLIYSLLGKTVQTMNEVSS